MANYTPNLNLKKPTGNEYYDVVAEDNDSKDKIDKAVGSVAINVLSISVDNTGQADIATALSTIQSNKSYFFPSGQYLLGSHLLLSGLKNVKFIFADDAELIDGHGVIVGLTTLVNGNVPYGIRFTNCENITINEITINNPLISEKEIIEADWTKRVPNVDFDACNGVTLNHIHLKGYTGHFVRGLYTLGVAHMMRATFVRITNSENVKITGSLDGLSGRGELFSLFNCKNVDVTDLSHNQTGTVSFWSLGKFIACENVKLHDITDIRSDSSGSLFDVSGSNVIIDNVSPISYPNASLFDVTKEWGLEGGSTAHVIIRNIKNDLSANLINTNKSGVSDVLKKEYDETLIIDNVRLENISVDGKSVLGRSTIGQTSFKNLYASNLNAKNVNYLVNMTKDVTDGEALNNVYIDKLTLENDNLNCHIEAYGETIVSNSKINLNGAILNLWDRYAIRKLIPINQSLSKMAFKSVDFKNTQINLSTNVTFDNCTFDNCKFIRSTIIGLNPDVTFKDCEILINKEVGSLTNSSSVFNFVAGGVRNLKMDNVSLIGNHENPTGLRIFDGVDGIELVELKNIRFKLIRYLSGVVMANQTLVYFGIKNGSGTRYEITNSYAMGGLALILGDATLTKTTQFIVRRTRFDMISTDTGDNRHIWVSGTVNFSKMKVLLEACDFKKSNTQILEAQTNLQAGGGTFDISGSRYSDWSIN